MLEEAFTAGILHDVGKLILADNPTTNYLQVIADAAREGRSLIEAEQAAFKATHAEVGAYLLDLWGLPSPLVEAVAYHHQPARASELEFGCLTAVHAANAFEQAASAGQSPDAGLDAAYLEHLQMTSRIEVWRAELDAI